MAPGCDDPPPPTDELFRLLVENARDYAIFTTDCANRVTTWGVGAETLLGYREDEIRGRDAALFFVPEDAERGEPMRELEQAAAVGRAEDERWHVRKDGSRFWASGVVTPLRDAAGRLRGFAKVMRDLTERKRLADELAASEARLRAIVDRSPVLIWRSGVDGRYDYFNEPWYVFRGRDRDHEVGQGLGWTEGIHSDDRAGYLERYWKAFARHEPFEATFRLRRHDGQYRWVTDRGVPYHDRRGHFLGYLGSCLDITERVELEAALRRQRELAEEAAGHKTRLMSALSHDARTPLNAVVLAAEHLALHLADRVDEETARDLLTIRQAVRNVLDLLSDLLNLVKIDAGADAAEPADFPLKPALAECLAGVEPQARHKGLEVRPEAGDLERAVLRTDRAKLKQVLSNLLSNALRYTERGHIRLRAARGGDLVRLAVEDTGVGIAPEDQLRVFDEFSRLGDPHRPEGEGTGLGLAICRRLASLLGGEITLESAPGRGSTFTLVLPATVLVADAPPEPAPAHRAPTPASGVVVVVEDNPASRQALARVLRRMGYDVREAGNGRDALALIRQARPVAVLMDVNMPVMDGIEATRALRADPATRDVPVYALTGDVTLVNRRRIGEAGVDGYLEKPVRWEDLQAALATMQGRRPAAEPEGRGGPPS